VTNPDDPREQLHRARLAQRAAEAEASIAAREAEAAASADPSTVAEFERLVAHRTAEEMQPPPPLVDAVPLPEWPVGVLPEWVRDHVVATSERLQVPVDLCAQLAVGVLAAIAMGHVRAVVHDWTEPAALFLYCAMHSGAGKSPAEKAMVQPLRDWEKARRIDGEDDYQLGLAEHRVAQKRAKELEAQHAKGACDVSEFREAALEAAQPPPVQYRLTVDDTTPERLTQLLAAHKRLALISTEAGLLDMVAGGYGNSGSTNLDVYLKAWSGETIIRDRKGGDGGPEATVVDDPLLCVVLTIQPSVIERYQQERPDLRGRGWFARFMPSVPESLVGLRTFATRPPTGDEAQRYADAIHHLADTLNAGEGELRYVLDDDAAQMFYRWCEDMEPDLAVGGRLEALHDQSSKIRSSVLRLAAILAAVNGTGTSVDVATVASAIEVGDYWTAHAMAVEGVIDAVSSEEAHAVKVGVDILDWCRRRQAVTFTPREVWRSLRRSYPFVEDLLPGFDILVRRGWVDLLEGTLDEIGHRGARVLARPHPVALTRSVRDLTQGERTAPRTRTALEVGLTPSSSSKSGLTPQVPESVADVAVLPIEDDDDPYGPLA
jgi:replicative DNA helicase